MLVILTDNQILAPGQVCQSCLLADQTGQPRWRRGRLYCGQAVKKVAEQQSEQFECVMGFRVAQIE
ncbi:MULTISPECIES: hypothetical protein [Cyanophyceae]|uniref:hypothetical protein n=1 Tax=Cyanophyceae TaxID=3028117 RepID=UPI000B4A1940|nr:MULTISPECIES: hypothetical protein [Cyanophyceae]NQZ65267.1 hypothetical protein [Crocosphaera sp.]